MGRAQLYAWYWAVGRAGEGGQLQALIQEAEADVEDLSLCQKSTD